MTAQRGGEAKGPAAPTVLPTIAPSAGRRIRAECGAEHVSLPMEL